MESEMQNKTTVPKEFGSNEIVEDEQQGQPISEIVEVEDKPKFYEEMADGNYKVHTKKDGDFIFLDLPYEKIVAVRKRLTRRQQDGTETIDSDKLSLALISESLVKPKIGELELMKMKGKTVIRLQMAITEIYDLTNFL